MEIIIILFIFGIFWLMDTISGSQQSRPRSISDNYNGTGSEDILSNGNSTGDYYDHGFTGVEVEFWGLDQPGAPEPSVAGWVIWDMVDGDLDGEIDF